MKHDHGRGKINDNALKALVTSKTFRSKVHEDRKKKSKYTRKAKHKNKDVWPSSFRLLSKNPQ